MAQIRLKAANRYLKTLPQRHRLVIFQREHPTLFKRTAIAGEIASLGVLGAAGATMLGGAAAIGVPLEAAAAGKVVTGVAGSLASGNLALLYDKQRDYYRRLERAKKRFETPLLKKGFSPKEINVLYASKIEHELSKKSKKVQSPKQK